MENIFTMAMQSLQSDIGIITLIVLFIILFGLKVFLDKSEKLNQKQTFSFLNILWISLLIFLFFLVIILLYPFEKDSVIENSFNGNRDSNISFKKNNLDIRNSIQDNNNSIIDIN